MDVIFVLLPVALLVAGLMLGLFIWAVRSGQFDDLDTPAVRILFDDMPAKPTPPPGPQTDASSHEAAAAPSPVRESTHSTGTEIR